MGSQVRKQTNVASILVVSNPSDTPTRFGYHWLKLFSEYATKRGHQIIFQKTPTLEILRQALIKYNPHFIIANGHGGFKTLSVDSNILIGIESYDEAINKKLTRQNPTWFKGRLVYLATCNAGRELAPCLVNYGAKAVAGYKEAFIFLTEEERSNPAYDKLAEPFFKAMLQLPLHLVNGETFGYGINAVKKTFERYRNEAESKGEEETALYLNHNLINFVSYGNMGSRL